MYDLIYLGVFAGFMAVAYGYVKLCDRIVEADRTNDEVASS